MLLSESYLKASITSMEGCEVMRVFTGYMSATVVLASCYVSPMMADDNDGNDMTLVFASSSTYLERVIAVQGFGMSLSTGDTANLCSLLSSHADSQPKLTIQEQASLKNDILNVLVAQQRLPDDLGQRMIDIVRDGENDTAWRVHCLNHFAPYYRRRWLANRVAGDDDAFADERAAIESEVRLAAASSNDEFAIAGLMVLDSISLGNDTVPRQEVVTLAIQYAMDTTRGSGLRAKAIDIAARAGKKEILPIVRVCAGSSDDAGLEHTAIRALGVLGTAEDRATVQGLARSADRGVRAAAQEALRRFAARHI